MADTIDQATELTELLLNAAIASAQNATGNERLTGFCRWCGDPTPGAFCSAPCRYDMNKAERMRV